MNDTFAEKAKMWDSNPQVMALADLFSAELDKIVPDHSGLAILELGCGWGSLTLFMAQRLPNAQITALSNSRVSTTCGVILTQRCCSKDESFSIQIPRIKKPAKDRSTQVI